MGKRIALCAVLVLWAWPAGGLAIDVDNPPVGVFSDEWYVILIKGQKSGHAHVTLERVKRPEGDVIRTSTDTVIEMGRAGSDIKVSVTQQTEESLAGAPLAFKHQMKLGPMPGPTTQGTIKMGMVTVDSSQFGQKAEAKTYPLPPGAMMTWALYREQLKRGLEPGTRYELPVYEPTLSPDRVITAAVAIGQREMIDLYGRKVEAVKTTQTMQIGTANVDTVSWITPEGDVLRVHMSMMNMPIEMIACPKPIALAPNDPAELMVDTLIRVDKPIDANARQITYRLGLESNEARKKLAEPPETDMQKVQRIADDQVRITVTRREQRPAAAGPLKLTPQERERYLAATSVVNYKDRVVARLATQAAGDEKDPWKLAERLCRFVDRYIESKSLGVGFATASEVARSKEGDCTEHGILLAALGRAAGVPTRVVAGILYAPSFAGHEGVFVGHLWTQFFIDGRWVDLDPSHGQIVVDPAHIALGLSDAGDSGIADLVSSVWLTLGNLKISVLESQGS